MSTGGTATEGSSNDYSLSASTLTISAGQSSASITINEGAANTTDEPTETITITAALASGESDARIKSSQKTLSLNLIDNDDTEVTWSDGGTIVEGTDSTISLTATLDNVKPFDTAITLDISGSATIDDDFSTEDDGFISTVKSSLSRPWGVVTDSNGNTYVSSHNNQVIYKIDSSGNQTVYAGKENNWENNIVTDAQPVSLARFRHLKSMAIDTSGSEDILYVIDDRVIKKINITTGFVYYITGDNSTWQNSFTNGEFDEAKFGHIQDIAVSNDGTALYILDQNAIRKLSDLSGDGLVETISGQWDWDYREGSVSAARYEGPEGIDMDSNGNLWVRQWGKLRKVDLSNDLVTTVFRNLPWGTGDLFIHTYVSNSITKDDIYFTDHRNHTIYKYSITDE